MQNCIQALSLRDRRVFVNGSVKESKQEKKKNYESISAFLPPLWAVTSIISTMSPLCTCGELGVKAQHITIRDCFR